MTFRVIWGTAIYRATESTSAGRQANFGDVAFSIAFLGRQRHLSSDLRGGVRDFFRDEAAKFRLLNPVDASKWQERINVKNWGDAASRVLSLSDADPSCNLCMRSKRKTQRLFIRYRHLGGRAFLWDEDVPSFLFRGV